MGEKLILDYELIRGLPGVVEEDVRKRIDSRHGWQPKGKPILMTIDGYEILVQCMVKYES